ncbi:hypothetical protein F4778DRAFT_756119 [Xylariomycetidae sp. FL2044]|nr:hypothetical protein F4778DRAFT_756119 [Xylariomycetidae sp. FL2044]
MYSPTPPPPVPPPKPSSHETSRLGTPTTTTTTTTTTTNSPRPPPPLPDASGGGGVDGRGKALATDASGLIPAQGVNLQPEQVPDPGEQWLPKILEDKSKQDLAEILSRPDLLNALTHSPATIHPSLASTRDALLAALDDNVGLAAHLAELEARLAHQRASAQAQLLSTHALERQWRAKEGEMDRALEPFSPAALYQRLTQGLLEQEMICRALEESFLDGGGVGGGGGGSDEGARQQAAGGSSSSSGERDIADWVRRFRDAKKLYYLRQERKERWKERRVGGWR